MDIEICTISLYLEITYTKKGTSEDARSNSISREDNVGTCQSQPCGTITKYIGIIVAGSRASGENLGIFS